MFTFLDDKFGREQFDAFLQGYFDHFAFKSITTEEFLGYLKENLLDRFPGIVSRDAGRAWVEEPGVPRDAPLLAHPSLRVGGQGEERVAVGQGGREETRYSRLGHTAMGVLSRQMPGPLRKDQLAELDQAFGFTTDANAEIAASWFVLVIKSAYQPGYARLEEFLAVERPSDAARAALRRAHEDSGWRGAREARVCAGAALSTRHTRPRSLDAIVNPASAELR